MPSRKKSDGTYRDIVHPINAEFRGILEEEVLRAYEEEQARTEAEAEIEAIESGDYSGKI
jgi:stage V sporulation protein G